MTKNCYGCKFALDARNLPRQGEQVRCGKAEELFGTDNIKSGQRWVNVRKGKNGQLLNSKCGEFQPFTGDLEIQEETPAPKKINKPCPKCEGTGKVRVRIMNKSELTNCYACEGNGRVEA